MGDETDAKHFALVPARWPGAAKGSTAAFNGLEIGGGYAKWRSKNEGDVGKVFPGSGRPLIRIEVHPTRSKEV